MFCEFVDRMKYSRILQQWGDQERLQKLGQHIASLCMLQHSKNDQYAGIRHEDEIVGPASRSSKARGRNSGTLSGASTE